MTEAEWDRIDDPYLLLRTVRDRSSDRKLRLFGCECCRVLVEKLTSRRTRRALEVAERYADGGSTDEELHNVYEASKAYTRTRPLEQAVTVVAGGRPDRAGAYIRKYGSSGIEINRQLSLIRDIFSNPFRPAPHIDSTWLTETVRGIAEAIYADRTFGNLPVLADALQDAGCETEEILTHLRAPGPHVRGCWALDLILGKS